jgi:hypothetical protein
VEKETMGKKEENKTHGHLANFIIIVCKMMMFYLFILQAKKL